MEQVPESLKKHPVGQFIAMVIFCAIFVGGPIIVLYEKRIDIYEDRLRLRDDTIASLKRGTHEDNLDVFIEFHHLQKASVLCADGRQELGTGGLVSTQTARLLEEGIRYLREQDYPNALVKFEAITDIQPYFPYAKYFKGFAYQRLGQRHKSRETFQEAISDFDLLLEVRPEDPHIFLFKGACYTFLKNQEKSMEMLNLAKEFKQNLVLVPTLTYFSISLDGLTDEQANIWTGLIKEVQQARETKQ